MTRTLLTAALLAAAAAPALADGAAGEPAAAAPLPPHIARHIAELRTHGTRFEKAIAAIEANAALPGWGWEDTCGHDDGDTALPAM